MDSAQKLLKLTDGITIMPIDGDSSPEEFRRAVQHNKEQLALLEAKGNEFLERALYLDSRFLAESLIPSALEKYGDSTEASLRKLLQEDYAERNVAAETSKFKQLALQELGKGLDEKQLENVGMLIEALPVMMIDVIVELAGRLTWAPPDSYNDIAAVLTRMLKEDGKDGDDQRTN